MNATDVTSLSPAPPRVQFQSGAGVTQFQQGINAARDNAHPIGAHGHAGDPSGMTSLILYQPGWIGRFGARREEADRSGQTAGELVGPTDRKPTKSALAVNLRRNEFFDIGKKR